MRIADINSALWYRRFVRARTILQGIFVSFQTKPKHIYSQIVDWLNYKKHLLCQTAKVNIYGTMGNLKPHSLYLITILPQGISVYNAPKWTPYGILMDTASLGNLRPRIKRFVKSWVLACMGVCRRTVSTFIYPNHPRAEACVTEQ